MATTLPHDEALMKPGWYGELQHNGLLLSVCSFEKNAPEARQFCRRLFNPVSYASLSLVNLGSPVPVILQSLEVRLHLDTGEEVASLPVRPLLEQRAGLNAELLKRITVPQAVAAGSMLADIPVCQEADFPWARVTAVTVSFSSRTLTIPGSLMTASEKLTLLEKSVSNDTSGSTNNAAEAWFKSL